MTPLQLHINQWTDCKKCELHTQRRQVVHVRGQFPCQIAFIGEAPGESEDVLKYPFIGPAGKVLDDIIRESVGGYKIPMAFFNLVGCFPKEGKKTGDHAPPDQCIKACAPRVKDLIKLARPDRVVCVGSLSTKWVRKLQSITVPMIDIVHPAAILHAPLASRSLLIKQSIVRLTELVAEIAPF